MHSSLLFLTTFHIKKSQLAKASVSIHPFIIKTIATEKVRSLSFPQHLPARGISRGYRATPKSTMRLLLFGESWFNPAAFM